MPADCCKEFWGRIPDDEPTFTLAARDALSAHAVRFWIGEALKEGVNADKIVRATQHLKAIEDFQRAHLERVKIPD
jgi:hypothetical protein